MDLDDFDRRILAALQADGRISIPDLAVKVGLSQNPCRKRIRRLEKAAIIHRYAAVVSPRALGLGSEAMVQVKMADHTEQIVGPFEKEIRNRREVVACYAVGGDFDFLLHLRTRDQDSLTEFTMNVVRRLPGVKNINSILVMRTAKSNLEWTVGSIADYR